MRNLGDRYTLQFAIAETIQHKPEEAFGNNDDTNEVDVTHVSIKDVFETHTEPTFEERVGFRVSDEAYAERGCRRIRRDE